MTAEGPDVESLRATVEGVRREVDALQNHVLKSHQPWYRTPSVLIAALALLFSFGTTFVSYQRTKQQDIHDARTELRTLILRLNALPKENLELTEKFTAKPLYLAGLQSVLNAENALVAKQAAEVIERIPVYVSATEYLTVAYALSNSGLLDKSLQLLAKAVATARDVNDEVGARRQYGGVLFMTGNLEGGRAQFDEALKVFSKYPSANGPFVEFTHALTHLYWSQSEAGQRQCNRAREHTGAAERHLTNLPPAPWTEQVRRQLAEVERQVISCVP